MSAASVSGNYLSAVQRHVAARLAGERLVVAGSYTNRAKVSYIWRSVVMEIKGMLGQPNPTLRKLADTKCGPLSNKVLRWAAPGSLPCTDRFYGLSTIFFDGNYQPAVRTESPKLYDIVRWTARSTVDLYVDVSR